MNNKLLPVLFVFFIPFFLNAQEIVTGLYTNPSLKGLPHKKPKSTGLTYNTIPFLDDFSGKDPYPDNKLWVNKFAFINSNYPYNPPTVGVATLDAIDDTGALYKDANTYGFIADSLTSQYIRLDSVFGTSPAKIRIKDSIYFSFLYQPQGIGNAPEKDDSLVVEFYSPKTGKWNRVWASQGYTLAAFYKKYNVWYKQVMIPITDSVNYFHKNFRFRFYNYASLANDVYSSWSGNADQWNIDYVYINKGRTKADSLYNDIAFINNAGSLLKSYYSMPWNQFQKNAAIEMKDSLKITISNLNNVVYNSTSYKYEIYNKNLDLVHKYNGGSHSLLPFSTSGYQTYLPHARPPVEFIFPSSSSDSASFMINHIIKEGLVGDSNGKNDTISFVQEFFNYYAYDDGTPEAGYGLEGSINAKLAYKFTLNEPDTLRAVKMFFNQTLANANEKKFYLIVWNEKDKKPYDIIYKSKVIKPQFEDSLNKYHIYKIDTTLIITGTFYVGWEQTENSNLNLGYDQNNDAKSNIFYNISGTWMSSNYKGALMIRPVFGKTIPSHTAITETQKDKNKSFIIYPNPANNGILNINYFGPANPVDFRIYIYDVCGNIILNTPYANTTDISGLSSGVYFVRISEKANLMNHTNKLIIIR